MVISPYTPSLTSSEATVTNSGCRRRISPGQTLFLRVVSGPRARRKSRLANLDLQRVILDWTIGRRRIKGQHVVSARVRHAAGDLACDVVTGIEHPPAAFIR